MKRFKLWATTMLLLLSEKIFSNEATEGLRALRRTGGDFKSSADGFFGSAVGAVLAVGLVFVVYQLANGKPNASKYLISWIIAVIVALGIMGMIYSINL